MNFGNYGLRFHHLGLAVRHPKNAMRFLAGLGYSVGEQILDPLQNVHLIWCTHSCMPAVELISSTDTKGPLDAYFSSGVQEIIYHVCFESKDAETSVAAMRRDNNRVLLVSPPKPVVLFANKEVSFHLVKGFGLIEILSDLEC